MVVERGSHAQIVFLTSLNLIPSVEKSIQSLQDALKSTGPTMVRTPSLALLCTLGQDLNFSNFWLLFL